MGVASRAEELARKRAWMERIYTPSLDNALELVHGSADVARTLPSFFVIGPPRTGTTWLYRVLQGRASLPAPTKETRFFDVHFHRGLKWYRAHFATSAEDRAIGEIAPTYFVSGPARDRIASLLPHAKVVCVFRDPVERLLSLYKLKSAYGLIRGSFEQAIERDDEMLNSSRYATNLKFWRNALGTNQVLVMVYDDLRDRPQAFLDALMDFIGIPRFCLAESQLEYVHAARPMTYPRSYHRTRSASTMADWFKARRLDSLVAAVKSSPLRNLFLGGGRPFAELPEGLTRKLYELFRPEVEELETILNRDLSTWKGIVDRS